jgi:hypothetical protein
MARAAWHDSRMSKKDKHDGNATEHIELERPLRHGVLVWEPASNPMVAIVGAMKVCSGWHAPLNALWLLNDSAPGNASIVRCNGHPTEGYHEAVIRGVLIGPARGG